MKVKGTMTNISMTGYNRIIRADAFTFLNRISKVTDIFQRLLLHSVLSFSTGMGWVGDK